MSLLLATQVNAHAPGEHKHGHGGHKPPAMPLGLQSLDVYRDGAALHKLTAEQRAGESAPVLFYRRSDDDGTNWSAPVRIDRPGAAPSGVRPGNDAQLAAKGNRVVAVWGVAGTGWGGSGPLTSALSDDGGRSWRAGPNPSDSGLTSGHGFVDLLFAGDTLHAVWLDSRDKSQGLRHARSEDGGTSWLANTTVAAGSCECCWNTLFAPSPAELLVMYRGKGPRDMAIASHTGGAWSRRGPVAAFNWQVKGCPETGGALARTPEGALHALVWTGVKDREGLYAVKSPDAALKWGPPVRLGTSDAQHADLAANGDTLLAVWDEFGVIQAARGNAKGWAAPQRISTQGADATHPRVLATPAGFVAFWGERTGKGERVLRMERVGR